ncbi:MAG TPA: aspartyl protease family protein [Streptosporangiaceae bacterium]|nr:aspartyl protease family protein [Streptosporangiaceae bacterium]
MARLAARAGTDTAAVTVPIKVARHGNATLELVPVTINGRSPFVFMLDTGSSVSSVSRRLAARLRLRSSGGTTQIRVVVTSPQVPLAAIGAWTLGTAALAPETVAVLPLAKTGGGSVAGLLGSDELRRFGSITADFSRQQLRLA